MSDDPADDDLETRIGRLETCVIELIHRENGRGSRDHVARRWAPPMLMMTIGGYGLAFQEGLPPELRLLGAALGTFAFLLHAVFWQRATR